MAKQERRGKMAVAMLKIMTDVLWYLSMMMPLTGAVPVPAKVVLFALPCIYGGWLFASAGKQDFSGDCQDILLFEGKILAFISFFELVILGVDSWQRQSGPFVLGFLLSGILLLRTCRISRTEQGQRGFWKLNGVSLLSVLAAAFVLASKTVRGGAMFLLSSTYQKLVLPVLLGILRLFLVGIQAVVSLFSFLFPGIAVNGLEMETVVLDTDTKVDFGDFSAAETPFYFKVIGILILIAAAAVLFYLVYRRISGGGQYEKRGPQGELHRSELVPGNRSEQDGGFLFQEKNVRYYYRKFLRLCRKKGMEIESSATSKEIERRAAGYWPENELSELGELYRGIRYGNRKDGAGERQKAREIYKKLKEKNAGENG